MSEYDPTRAIKFYKVYLDNTVPLWYAPSC